MFYLRIRLINVAACARVPPLESEASLLLAQQANSQSVHI
jgi:hypothetical protein